MTSPHSDRSPPLTSLSGHSAAHQLSLRPLQQKASPTRSNGLGFLIGQRHRLIVSLFLSIPRSFLHP